jgi:hypothetical protein
MLVKFAAGRAGTVAGDSKMVTVVGSCNFDQVVFVPELPSPGQTIYGTKYITGFGGKGANQVRSANLCHNVNDFCLTN